MLCREKTSMHKLEVFDSENKYEEQSVEYVSQTASESSTKSRIGERPNHLDASGSQVGARSLLKSESIGASRCFVVNLPKDNEVSVYSHIVPKTLSQLSLLKLFILRITLM